MTGQRVTGRQRVRDGRGRVLAEGILKHDWFLELVCNTDGYTQALT